MPMMDNHAIDRGFYVLTALAFAAAAAFAVSLWYL
jgi:hypothetical protein